MYNRRPPEFINDTTRRPGIATAVLGWLAAIAIIAVVALVVFV